MATVDPTALTEQALAAPDPSDRLRAIVALRAELDDLEADAVRSAVRSGSSWAQVASAMGITKQSAHKRYAARLADDAAVAPRRRALPAQPAEKVLVTAQARRAVRAARAAARALDHAEVDPGHLLLGLMAEPPFAAARALNAIGVTFDAARDAVRALGLPITPAGASARRRIPISAAAQAALEQSLRESRRLGHNHLGVEHLLLALLRDELGGAVRALERVGIPPDDLERCLGKVLKEAPFASR